MQPDLQAIDVFAGPGGWDEGLLDLGIRPLGVEWDDAACLTRAAAGHLTLQADVAELDPHELVPAGGHVDLLIGSPPCPTFSAAGGGSGNRVGDVILECLDALRDGRDERAPARERAYQALLPGAIEDERASAKKKNRPFSLERAQEKARRNATMSLLVVEPFRYALELRPRWIALEQVPPVLPIWQRLAADLRQHGWNVWTGLISSEQFGVPQTRERAILLADLQRLVRPPAPTHQRYVPPRKEPDLDRLFEPGRRERIVARGEEHLVPWVSMADALGWSGRGHVGVQRGQGMEERHGDREPRPTSDPAPTIRAGSKGSGPNLVVTGEEDRPARTLCGHHTPRWLYDGELPPPQDGISVLTRGEDGSRGNDVFDATERPSRAVTGRAYSLLIDGVDVPEDGGGIFVQRERSGDRSQEGFDPAESPAQALTSKARSWELIDERSPEFNRGPVDPEEQPAPAVSSTARQWRVRNYHAKDDTESHETGGPVSPTFDPGERPARTVTHRVGGWEVEVEEGADPPSEAEVALALDERRWTLRTGDNTMSSSRDPEDMIPYERSLDDPAPTLTAKTGGAWKIAPDGEHVDPPMSWKEKQPGDWGYERPSTTVAGDPRVPQPGHKKDAANPDSPRRMEDAVRLSVAEASILQGFRSDYPWQGSRTKQFEQVGNAVPPPLARACVAALIGET